MKARRALGCMSRKRCFLRGSVVQAGGKWQHGVLSVDKGEWEGVLHEVVMPCFIHSTKMVSPFVVVGEGGGLEPMEQVQQSERLSAKAREDLLRTGSVRHTWLEGLGCVLIEKKTSYLRHPLFTGLVPAANVGKARAVLRQVGNPWGVHLVESPKGVLKVTFTLQGVVVKAPMLDQEGQAVGGDDGKGEWARPACQEVETHRLSIMLCRLVFFMSRGFHMLGRSPFIEPPWSEASVVVHYYEAKPSGRYCCPWHMGPGTKQENTNTALEEARHGGVGRRTPW